MLVVPASHHVVHLVQVNRLSNPYRITASVQSRHVQEHHDQLLQSCITRQEASCLVLHSGLSVGMTLIKSASSAAARAYWALKVKHV